MNKVIVYVSLCSTLMTKNDDRLNQVGAKVHAALLDQSTSSIQNEIHQFQAVDSRLKSV